MSNLAGVVVYRDKTGMPTSRVYINENSPRDYMEDLFASVCATQLRKDAPKEMIADQVGQEK